ncbi:MAG: hypothetical protein ACTSWW_05545 [Promethearchaeota archaeon]
MPELLITKKRYLQLPEEISLHDKNPSQKTKLSLHFCTNGRVSLTDADWANLEYLEIIGCKYLDLVLNFSRKPSSLKQILIANCEYLNIGTIFGQFPVLDRITFDNCKFIKFKGSLKGEIHLKTLDFKATTRSMIFQEETSLPALERLIIRDQSHFFKLDLSKLTAPNLTTLWFQNSNYLQIVSLGKIASQLQSFKFEHCTYPKLNVDFSKLKHSNQGPSKFEPVSSVFRKVKKRPIPPDIELLRSSASPETVQHDAAAFLASLQRNEDSPDTSGVNKFCSQCGHLNPITAEFCASCGYKFREIHD